MTDPNLVISGLSQKVVVAGEAFKVDIYRLEDELTWTLEVVDKQGTSTVWDHQFGSDQEALDEVFKAIRDEGLAAFRENAKVIPFPKG
jgi:hypothetical protein